MIFKLPDPPAGQSYVTRQGANGPETILVPTSSLSEDICAATGRTWAEEARLNNIRNAPDTPIKKDIAEPGDPFYHTAETMKNRGKEIAGGIGTGGLVFFNLLSSTAADSPPNLSTTIDKIKSGSINADIASALDKIGEVSGSLPAGASADIAAAKTAIAAKMAALQAQLPKLLAMAQMNTDILTKKKIAETGQPPTETEIKAAQGAIAIFQDGPRLLESKAAEVSKEVATAGTDFGAKLTTGLNKAADFAKAGLTKVTALAKTAGVKISEFASGVPSATVPDPANPSGPAIPNPTYVAFAAIPANASKLTSLADIKTKLDSAAADMSSKFAELETVQDAATTSTMADLKAFGFAAKLSQTVTGLAATVQNFALDPTAFDPTSIAKTFSQASQLGASIDTSLYSKTKDEDLTYGGDDGIVWDRSNAERLRRGLPGLAAIGSPRPLDPPLVPAGPTPPKDPSTVIREVKTVKIDETPTATTATTKKKAVFDKDLDEKIYNPFVKQYFKVFSIFDTRTNALDKEIKDGLMTRWIGSAFDFSTLSTNARKVLEDKPDATTRTAEETLLVKQREFYKQLTITYSTEYVKYKWTLERRNEINEQYGILRAAFMAGKAFGDLPTSVETAVMKDSGPDQWKKFVSGYYDSFTEFSAANPDKITPPSA